MDRRRGLAVLGIRTWRARSAPREESAVRAAGVPPLPPAPAAEAHAQQQSAPRATPPSAPAPAPAAVEPVAADWDGLSEQVRNCPRCKLCKTRTQAVFGVGIRTAPLMVIGEGPGADEDAKGEPFVGRAGKLLDEMLAAIGRSRKTDVYIANVVKCRPPGNRDPEPDEVEACRPYLDQQIRLLRPRLIVALGRVASQRLLQTDQPLSKLRGPQYSYGPEGTPVLLTYHPAYLLRSPREKARAWEDLKRIEQFLRAHP